MDRQRRYTRQQRDKPTPAQTDRRQRTASYAAVWYTPAAVAACHWRHWPSQFVHSLTGSTNPPASVRPILQRE